MARRDTGLFRRYARDLRSRFGDVALDLTRAGGGGFFLGDLGVSINGATAKWMVYRGKSHENMDDFMGVAIPKLGMIDEFSVAMRNIR